MLYSMLYSRIGRPGGQRWNFVNRCANITTNVLQAALNVLLIQGFIEDQGKDTDLVLGFLICAGMIYAYEATNKYTDLCKVYYQGGDSHFDLLTQYINRGSKVCCRKENIRPLFMAVVAALLNGCSNGISLYKILPLLKGRENQAEDRVYSFVLGLCVFLAQFYFFKPGERPIPLLFSLSAIIQNFGKASFQTYTLYDVIKPESNNSSDLPTSNSSDFSTNNSSDLPTSDGPDLGMVIGLIIVFMLIFITHYNARILRQQALDIVRKLQDQGENTNPFTGARHALLWTNLARVAACLVAFPAAFFTVEKAAKHVGYDDADILLLQCFISPCLFMLCFRNFLPLLELYNTLQTNDHALSPFSYCFGNTACSSQVSPSNTNVMP